MWSQDYEFMMMDQERRADQLRMSPRKNRFGGIYSFFHLLYGRMIRRVGLSLVHSGRRIVAHEGQRRRAS